MRWKWLILTATLALTVSVDSYAQVSRQGPYSTRILRNRDVLAMVRSGMKPEPIITRILTSTCNFDVFPPVLDEMRRRGVPEAILQVMSAVPYGPPDLSDSPLSELRPETSSVRLPKGMGILVESLYPVSSADAKLGSQITFAAVQPVFVDGVLVVARGAIARARVVRARKAKILGRGGALTLELEHIVAVDGTLIPVQLSAVAEGKNQAGQLAAGAALTSALVFPYTAPAALVWGFKKGNDAVLRGSQQFAAVLRDDTEIQGVVTDKDRVIYHTADALKTKVTSNPTVTNFPRLPVRN